MRPGRRPAPAVERRLLQLAHHVGDLAPARRATVRQPRPTRAGCTRTGSARRRQFPREDVPPRHRGLDNILPWRGWLIVTRDVGAKPTARAGSCATAPCDDYRTNLPVTWYGSQLRRTTSVLFPDPRVTGKHLILLLFVASGTVRVGVGGSPARGLRGPPPPPPPPPASHPPPHSKTSFADDNANTSKSRPGTHTACTEQWG
jgi:hypothetical protein